MKVKDPLFPVVDGDPDNIRRQQVTGELDALIVQPEQPGQQVGQGGLAHAWQVFDQQMPAGQQAGDRQAQSVLLAEDDVASLLQELVQGVVHDPIVSAAVSLTVSACAA